MSRYTGRILDHYKSPRNLGHIKAPSCSRHAENPSCGDNITIEVQIEGDTIKDIKFSGEGCAIAIASASSLTEKVKGMKLVDIADITLQDIEEMLSIKLTPAREHCALLPLTVLRKIVLKELKKAT